MAGPLATLLSTSYGSSKHYTVGQIETAFGKLKINPKYIDYAYAEYLTFEECSEIRTMDRAFYDSARALYEDCLPHGYSSMEPAPMNTYVAQGGRQSASI